MGIPPLFSVTGDKKWSMPRAQEYREMLLILLRRSLYFAILKCNDAVKVEIYPLVFSVRVPTARAQIGVCRNMHLRG